MKHLHAASTLGHADDFDAIINELCVSAEDEFAHRTQLLQIKATSPVQRFRRPGTVDPPAHDTQRDAIVAIGKAVIDQGKKIDAFIAKHSVTPNRARDLRLKTFETFKEVNDRRLEDQRTKGRSDGLDEAQLERINKALDRIADVDRRLALAEVKRNRPHAMGTRTLNGVETQSTKKLAEARLRKAVVHYMRTGQEMFEGEHLSVIQKKALHSELNPDGGYLVLPERANSPLRTFLTELSMMRQRAQVMEITTAEFQQPVRTGGANAGWVAERGARPETGTPTLGVDKYPTMELYAEPGATQTLLDDAVIDIEAWLAEEIAEAFNLQESDAWFNGNGQTQPRGLLTYPFVTDANWSHGKFRFVITGAAAAFPTTNPADALINQQYTLKQGHRQNASWLMNRATIGEGPQVQGHHGPVPVAAVAGGRPAANAARVPSRRGRVHAGPRRQHFPVGFGDWRKTYLIVDRIGVRVLRDQYTKKPFVLFYTTKRVGGGAQNFDAAIFLKCST